MKLVPFSSQYLRPKEALPFGVRDASGQLLLAAGQRIDTPELLAHLTAQKLFADEAESQEWRRRLAAAMDQMVRQNASLKEIAAARPTQEAPESRTRAEATLPEQWEDLTAALDAALRDARPDSDWLARVAALHTRARRLGERRLDASLYYLIHTAGASTQRYSSQHGLLALLVGEQAAALLGADAAAIDVLGRAALTMNVAMVRLQDQLAATDAALGAAQRAEIAAHPAQGAALLRASGEADERLIEIVERHHEDRAPADPSPDQAQTLSQVLRRVDVFTAKLSRRRTREPMSPVQAARQACLGPDGRPDAIGAALLKAVGLYPPGSYVQLATGEIGIVAARGRHANHPVVASLVAAAGTPMGEPVLRDTADARYAVRAAVPMAAVKVRPVHARVLALL